MPIYSCRCGHGYSTANWNKRFEIGILAFEQQMMKTSKRWLSLPRFCMHSIMAIAAYLRVSTERQYLDNAPYQTKAN